MVKDSSEPREFDAVKGGQVPPPVSGAVLGGIEGLRQRFASLNEQVRLDAVENACNYGDEGIDILIKALKDTSLQVRVRAYEILKELNKAESEIAQGIRLNVGDKIYCVYLSSLEYGDDWYYLEDSIDEYYEEYEEKKQLFYKPQSDDGDGYAHYIRAFTEKKKTAWDYYDFPPILMSLHILRDKAFEVAHNLHLQRLLELDKEYGMIYEQPFHDKGQLSQWCQDNSLSLTSNSNEDEDDYEYEYEFQIRIFKFLQQGSDVDLLKKFWEFTVNGRLAFVYERTIDRKCYLKTTDNYEIHLAM